MTNIIAENNKTDLRSDIKRRKQAGGGTCVYRDCLLLSIQ